MMHMNQLEDQQIADINIGTDKSRGEKKLSVSHVSPHCQNQPHNVFYIVVLRQFKIFLRTPAGIL